MARATGVSESTVGRIWRAHKPHLARTFKLSNDKQFVGLEDVVGLYLNPPENAIVLSCERANWTVSPLRIRWTTGPVCRSIVIGSGFSIRKRSGERSISFAN